MRKLIVVAFAAIVLAGCASFDAKLNTTTKIHAATTRSVTNALDAEIISSKDAEAYQEIAVNSSYILDSARALKDTNIQSAEAKLNLANKILVELQNYLLEQEGK